MYCRNAKPSIKLIVWLYVWNIQTLPHKFAIPSFSNLYSNNESLNGFKNGVGQWWTFITQTLTEVSLNRLEKGFSNQTITQFLHTLGKLIHADYLNATFISLYATLEELGYNTETMMFELRHPCDRLIKQCGWLGKVVRCEHLFRTSRSSEGFCCSFNYKASKQYLET